MRSPREGWILYDGGCGFCFRWVHFWKICAKHLQSASADSSLQISQENLLDDIRVLTRTGKRAPMHTSMWHDEYGGRGFSMRSSACRASTVPGLRIVIDLYLSVGYRCASPVSDRAAKAFCRPVMSYDLVFLMAAQTCVTPRSHSRHGHSADLGCPSQGVKQHTLSQK